jgi:hypothetical protein
VLVVVLIVTTIVAGMAAMMLALTDVDVAGASSARDGAEAFYAADAALEMAIDELAALPSWTPALTGSSSARWTGGGSTVQTPLGVQLDLPRATSTVQAESDAAASLGANNPVWRLFGHAPVSALFADSGPLADIYVVVWVADDRADTDRDPSTDANDSIQLRAEAHGRRHSRRIVESVISREAPGVVRQRSWKEVR